MPKKIIKNDKKNKIFFLLISFLKKRNGKQKKVIDIKLREYVPIKDNICKDSKDQDQEYEIRFQGKPVNIFPLRNSNSEKTRENNKIKKIFFLAKGPIIKITKPKNSDKNKGINITAKGINPINISSCVKDIEIQ